MSEREMNEKNRTCYPACACYRRNRAFVVYVAYARTTPVYAGSSREIISDGSNFAVSASYYSGLDKAEVDTALLDVQDGVEAY